MSKVGGKYYNSIKALYTDTFSCIKINGSMTNWFQCFTGVGQGDNLLPTIFSVFVNDLASVISELGVGVQLWDSKCSLLLYADDIVFLAESEYDLQVMLDTMHEWCKRWRLPLNTPKSKVVHFRLSRQPHV